MEWEPIKYYICSNFRGYYIRGRQVCKDFRGLIFADHQVEYMQCYHKPLLLFED